MGRGGWGCAESGRRKALCSTFPGCRSGRLDFLHRDHRVALSGGNPRQTPRRGGGRGNRKTGPGKKERLGEERCWPHSMREAIAFRAPQRNIYLPSVTPLSPACPVSPPSSSSKNASSCSFVAWNHWPKIQRPNTSHTTIDSSFLSLLPVLNVNFQALFAQIKCGVKYPHVTIADWEKKSQGVHFNGSKIVKPVYRI